MKLVGFIAAFLILACSRSEGLPAGRPGATATTTGHRTIVLDFPAPSGSEGGLVASDLDGDSIPDFLVTVPGHVGAWSGRGEQMWVVRTPIRLSGQSEAKGLPGHHAPGVQAADMDGDGAREVVFLTADGALHVIDGRTGREEWTVSLPAPGSAQAWEHVVVATFGDQADGDLLLQATPAEGYRMGRYLAAFSSARLREGELSPRWSTESFDALAHGGARVADLDGDGRDEVLGGTVLGPEGQILHRFPLKHDNRDHVDAIMAADIRPDLSGLEVVALQETHDSDRQNHVFVYNLSQDRGYRMHHRHQEPQNAAVADFDPERAGLEIWCRSRYERDQRPFVFAAGGRLLAEYDLSERLPGGWVREGVEEIWPIHWTGEPEVLAAAKERHRSGRAALFEPMTGRFREVFDVRADRLYVADVEGDWREEVVVLQGNTLHIYRNEAPNPRPERSRLWEDPAYTRSRMTWNYYNP
jgi:hypothetical protein